MKRNEALYSYRLAQGLSRKEAAQILGISKTLLRNYEEGYIYLKDETAKKFASSYGTEEGAFLLDDKGYIGAISYDKPVQKEPFRKLKDAFASFPAIIIDVIIFVVFLVVTIEGIVNYQVSFHGRAGYLTEEYVQIYETVRSGGEASTCSLYGSLMDDPETYSVTTDSGLIVKVPQNETNMGLISFSFVDSQEGTFYLECFTSGYAMASYESKGVGEITEIGIATYDVDTDALTYTLTPGNTKSLMSEDFPILEEKIASYLSMTTKDFFLSLENGNFSLASLRFSGVHLIFFGGIFVSLSLLAFVFGMVRRGKKKENVFVRVENMFVEEEKEKDVPIRRELPNSFHPAPFIFKEDYLRIFFLVLFFIGGSSTLLSLFSSSFIYTDFYNGLRELLPYFTGIATFMIFFLKLEAIISRRNTLLAFLTCLSLGFLFYIGEVYLTLLLSSIGRLGEIIAHVLPSNMFTGLAALALFAFFLLKEPKDGKRWQIILFHSLSILPLAYLIIGFIILGSGESYGPFVTGALNGGLFEVSIVGVSYIFFLFLSRKISFHLYGKKGGEEFLKGNRFSLIRNIFLTIMVVVVVVLAYILPSSVSLWSLEQDKYLLVLIPVFLLYRTRYPKSTVKGEFLFDASYFVLLALPYLYTGINYLIRR